MKIISTLILISCTLIIQSCSHYLIYESNHNHKKHVKYLASDKLEGRFPGTEGGKEAAIYIKNNFRENGLTLMENDGFQSFQVVTDVTLGSENKLEINDNNFTAGESFTPLSFTENANFNGSVCVTGYGFNIQNDSLIWNDYENINVENKWVMILRGGPDGNNPHGPYSEYSSLRTKVLNAKDNSAAGVIFVSGSEFDSEDQLIELKYEQNQVEIGIPVIHISRKVADLILKESQLSMLELEQELIQKKETFNPFFIDITISAETEIKYEYATTQNVVATIPGNDENFKNEFIVIGAHYDHLGYGGYHSGSRRPDSHEIHNGADDNASGVSVMLELSRKFAKDKDNKRSILFVAFGAEEMGLLGSKYFVNNPLIPIENIHLMLNLDMVGRLDKDENKISIGGSHTAIDLEKNVESIIQEYSSLNYSFSPEGYGPSDHSSFYVKDIPVLFFFTGAHSDYHTPNDDFQKLNYHGMRKIANIMYYITNFFDSENSLVFQEAGPKSEPKRKRFKVTLGVMPDYTYTETPGLRIDAVLHNKPAKNAGLEDGDIIISIADKPVGDIYEYMHRLSEISSGETAKVVVLRNKTEISFQVTF